MMPSRFDIGSTSKTLNLSLLRFNEQSGSENLDIYIYIYMFFFDELIYDITIFFLSLLIYFISLHNLNQMHNI